MTRAIVLLNHRARGGTGARRYLRIRERLASSYRLDIVPLEDGWQDAVAHGIASGVRTLIAAGGDGTVGALAGAIVERRGAVRLEDFALGAVGLGSSNDFHKPVTTAVAGVPLRIGAPGGARDLGRVRFVDEAGCERERIFVVSASVGATAAANARFNQGRLLKRASVGLAILDAAARTIAAHRSIAARLRIGDESEQPIALDNLSVLKTPYLSGSFRYDTPIEPRRLAVNLCSGMGRARLVATLAALACGRFRGRPGTRSWSAGSLELSLETPMPLELDGELCFASRMKFDVLPERIRACA